jgi:hypothetical protein
LKLSGAAVRKMSGQHKKHSLARKNKHQETNSSVPGQEFALALWSSDLVMLVCAMFT